MTLTEETAAFVPDLVAVCIFSCCTKIELEEEVPLPST